MKTKYKRFKRIPADFSRRHFFEWLKKQKGSREFCYVNNYKCLFASFFNEMYGPAWMCGGSYVRRDKLWFALPDDLHHAAVAAGGGIHFSIKDFRSQLRKEEIKK